MILYDPLWEYMKKNGITQYYLGIHGIGHSTITRLKHNQHVTTETLDRLCDILNCRIEDILVFKKSKK